VTVNLRNVSASGVTITLSRETDTLKDNVQNVAYIYNGLVDQIDAYTGYDATTKKAGVLQGQATAPVYFAGKDAGFAMLGDLNFGYQHPWQADAFYYYKGDSTSARATRASTLTASASRGGASSHRFSARSATWPNSRA
jgi:hypothetical protein